MKKLHELKADRASKIKEQDVMVQLIKKEDRKFNEDEVKRFDALQVEFDNIEKDIVEAEKIMDHEKRMAALVGEPIGAPAIIKKEKEERYNLISSIRNMVAGKQMSSLESSLAEESDDELKQSGLGFSNRNGVSIPSYMFRGQSVTDDAGAKGGALVGSDPRFVEPLIPKLTLETLGADVSGGLVGNVPLITSELFQFDYLDETTALADTDVNFAGPVLKPKRLAGSVLISRKLIAQSSIDIEMKIKELLRQAINAAILRNAINGAGGVAPTGLYSLITSNINTTAGALTWDTAVNLESLIKQSDSTEMSLAYLSDPQLMGSAKTIKKDAGSGIFLSDNNMMNGSKYVSSSLVPTLDAGVSHPLIFGDWKQMSVGFWGGMNILVDPYTKSNSSQVKLNIEIFNDIAVTNEKAFAINKVITVA